MEKHGQTMVKIFKTNSIENYLGWRNINKLLKIPLILRKEKLGSNFDNWNTFR